MPSARAVSFGRNNMLQALRFADEALGLDAPDFATLRHRPATSTAGPGEQDKALKVFEQCVEMAPEHPTALYNLATSLRFFFFFGSN